MKFPWNRNRSESMSQFPLNPPSSFPMPSEAEIRQAEAAAKARDALPAINRDEPIRALKLAHVVIQNNELMFAALSAIGARYGPVDTAACLCYEPNPYSYRYSSPFSDDRHIRSHHKTPSPYSNCGFYAWKDEQLPAVKPGLWLLEVDLYGTVIECETGYRAQKQRVLSISPGSSLICDAPDRLVVIEGNILAKCPQCPRREVEHPVSVDRLRSLLNVEINMERAWKLSNGCPA